MTAVRRFPMVLTLLLAAAALAWALLGRPPLGVDDAFIFAVYARNLVAGHGLVYNPGGERVEGFSSPLWMLVMAGFRALTDEPEPWIAATGIALVAALLAGLWQLLDGRRPLGPGGVVLLGWTLGSPGFVIWTSLALMDTPLWMAVAGGGALAALRGASSRRVALFVGLALLTRPEAMLWGLVVIAAAMLVEAARADWRAGARAAAAPVVAYASVLGGLTLFRLTYFGFPLPNTYYAKMSPDVGYNLMRGMVYHGRFIWSEPVACLLVLPVIAGLADAARLALGRESSRASPRLAASALLAAAGLFVPLWTGGDHFALFRFVQPVRPLLVLPAFAWVEARGVEPRRATVLAIAFVVLAATLTETGWFRRGELPAVRHEFDIGAEGRATGEALDRMFPEPRPAVGTVLAGGLALTYGGDVIDVMGLNNLAMGHSPGDRHGEKNHAAFDAETFFRLRPDLFLPLAGEPSEVARRWRSYSAFYGRVLRYLPDDRRFRRDYVLADIRGPGGFVRAYVVRPALEKLGALGLSVEPR